MRSILNAREQVEADDVWMRAAITNRAKTTERLCSATLLGAPAPVEPSGPRRSRRRLFRGGGHGVATASHSTTLSLGAF